MWKFVGISVLIPFGRWGMTRRKFKWDCKDAWWSNNPGEIWERFVGTHWARSGLWTDVWNIGCYRLWAFRRPGSGTTFPYSMNIYIHVLARWGGKQQNWFSKSTQTRMLHMTSEPVLLSTRCNVLLHIKYTHMFVWNPISLNFLFLVFIEFLMTKILGIQLLPHHRSENYSMTCTHELFFSLVWNFTQLQSF